MLLLHVSVSYDRIGAHVLKGDGCTPNPTHSLPFTFVEVLCLFVCNFTCEAIQQMNVSFYLIALYEIAIAGTWLRLSYVLILA